MSTVETFPVVVLTSRCETRGDKWAEEVLHLLLSCNDLLAEEAVYHNVCMTNFRLTLLA